MNLRRVKRVVANYSSGIQIKGLDPEVIAEIKRDLTFDNPAYASTQKYSRYSYTTVLPYLTYYSERGGVLTVPIGYGISHLNIDRVSDSRTFEKIDTAPFVLTLRESQREASERYLKLNQDCTLRGSIQMPTAKGKSILGLYLASVLSTKTLIIVHKDDLVVGWQDDIKLAFDGKVNPGLIKAKSRRVGHFLTIATIQTLNNLSKEDLQDLYSQFGFVIQDEMHHCPSSTFGLVSNFKSRYKLGLTATPERADGLAHVMTLYFGDFCYVYKNVPGRVDKDILPVLVKVRKNSMYIDPVCTISRSKNKTSYKVQDLLFPENKALNSNQIRLSRVPYNSRPRIPFHTFDNLVVLGIAPMVVEDLVQEYLNGRSCVVFFTQKEHCRHYRDLILEVLPEANIGLYYGDNPSNDEVKIKAENTRQFITLTTYAKATEGTNVKQWEVEFLVSSVNNEKNVEQAVGRIRRTKDGDKINPVLVYDYRTPYVYSISSHGSTRDRRYKKLGFRIDGLKYRKLFSRGFK